MVVTVRDATAKFADHLAGLTLAEGTVRRYDGSMRGQFGFLAACQKVKGPNVTMGQVDHECVTTYFRLHPGAAGSRNNKLAALRKFLNWAEEGKMLRPGFTAAGLLNGQKHTRPVRTPKLYLAADEFPRFLECAGRHHPRDRATVALILYTLARQSEVAVMRLRDIDLENRTIEVYRKKTRRYTTTGITPELFEELFDYLAWYSVHTLHASIQQMMALHPDWLLVPNGRHGEHWWYLEPNKAQVAMEKVVQRALAEMGYTDLARAGAHTGRRSGARAMFLYLRDALGYDGALVRVQTMLDHESPEMTLVYVGMDQERDSLNTWLKSNSMYGPGPAPQVPADSNVVPIRKRRSA